MNYSRWIHGTVSERRSAVIEKQQAAERDNNFQMVAFWERRRQWLNRNNNGPTPKYSCNWCWGEGGWEIYHPSTDALIGWRNCKHPIHLIALWKFPREYKWKLSEAEIAALPPF
jgi:hypothetical protein